ncbi:MAG: hypothetical protein OEX81_03965 [Candidatus Pacebacteria bacterium]|nr:hypothetical protein [Candidatus Paceibacterota bacterium]
MKKKQSKFSAVLGLFFLVFLALTGYSLTSSQFFNFDLRKKASGEPLTVNLVSSSQKVSPNQAFTVDIEINTQGKFISGLQFIGEITGVDQDKSGLIVHQPAGLNPIHTEMKKSGENLQFKFIELATLGTQAFTSHDQNIKVTTLFLYPIKDGDIKIVFDQGKSGALEFEKEFLSSNISQTAYNIEIDDGRGGGSIAPPDQGIHRSCNEYCADSNECASEFSCYYNRCRNPKNLTQVQCADPIIITQPVVTTQVTTKTTSQQKGGTKTTDIPFETKYVSLTSTPVKEEATSSSVIATVIITQADKEEVTPSPSPKVSPQIATQSSVKVRNLGSAKPQPSPTISDNTNQKKSSNLPLLIGAALLTGVAGIIAVLFFIKNLNSK